MADSGQSSSTIDLKATFAAKVGDPNAYELLSQSLATVSDADNPASIQLSGAQQVVQESKKTEIQKRRRDQQARDAMDIMNQARRLSEMLSEQIAAMETTFQAEYGDAWREVIANKVMNPDAIPQRRKGESMADYRERLEVTLIATMIDPMTGKAKPEFANSDDPATRRYAQWAEAQHQKNDVDAYLEKRSDPSLSDAERDRLDRSIAPTIDVGRAILAEEGLTASNRSSATISDEIDQSMETAKSDANAEAAAFGVPFGS